MDISPCFFLFFKNIRYNRRENTREAEETNLFKLNFQKLRDDWWNSLSTEQQERIVHMRTLEKEHLYYETTTKLDDNYKGRNREEVREVKLYQPVYRKGEDIKVGERILLSFGGYCEYSFDKRFCLKLLHDFKKDRNKRFCIDAGNELYVKNTEMIRIVKEALEALVARNIELTDDYFPNLTNSGMGKMLNEMGLH